MAGRDFYVLRSPTPRFSLISRAPLALLFLGSTFFFFDLFSFRLRVDFQDHLPLADNL